MRVSTVFTVSAVIDGDKGEQGNPGDYTDVRYAWSAYDTSESSESPPEDLQTIEVGEEDPWKEYVPVQEEGKPYLWMRNQRMTWNNTAGRYVGGAVTFARLSSESTPVYTLTPSASDIKEHADGSRTPEVLTFRATKAVGQQEPEVLTLSQPVNNAPCYFVQYKKNNMNSWSNVSRTGSNYSVIYNELSVYGDYETVAFRLVYRNGENASVLCETPAIGLTLDGDGGAAAVSFYIVGDGKTLELDKDGDCYATKQFSFSLMKKVGSSAPVQASDNDAYLTVWREVNGVLQMQGSVSGKQKTISHEVEKWETLTGLVCRAFGAYSNGVLSQELCPAFSVPVVKTGQDGAMNVRPVIYRITEWQPGQRYRNDSDLTDTSIDRYIDIVTIGVNSQQEPTSAYIYKNRSERPQAYSGAAYDTHVSVDETFDSNDPETLYGKPASALDETPFWKSFELSERPMMAPLAYFVQAIIQYLQVGQIVLTKDGLPYGAIGYGGYDNTSHEHLGAPLYLGGASAELANFRVSYEGRLYSIGADISGTVRVTELVGGEAVERVLISNGAISQGIIDEPETIASTAQDRPLTTSHVAEESDVVFTPPPGSGLIMEGMGMNCIAGTPVVPTVRFSLDNGGRDLDDIYSMGASVRFKWVDDDGELTEETELVIPSVTSLEFVVSTIGITPRRGCQNLRLVLTRVSFTVGENSSYSVWSYDGTLCLWAEIRQNTYHPQKTVIGRNGIYVGAGASSLSGTRVSSWLYADQNRMEMQTGNYGLRCLIGGSATSNIEGVQARSIDSAGTPQWFSLLGTVMTIGSAGSFSINHGTRLVIVSASSGTVTLNLGSGCHDCHEVFIKKTGGCTLNLSGTIIGRNTESVSAIGDNKMHHFICAGTTWYMLEGY